MGDIFIIICNPIFVLNSILCTSTILLNFCLYDSSLFDYDIKNINILNSVTVLENTLINEMVYKNYLNKLNKIPFLYQEFNNKALTGEKNIDYIRFQLLRTIEEKVWVRNNFRLYNTSTLINISNQYFNNLKYLHSDYTFNSLLYKYNKYTFNSLGKINIRVLMNNNFPYYYDYKYLKIVFSYNLKNITHL